MVATTTTRAPLRTSVGLKALMAVTGILLVLFLIAHMLGNLKIFAGQTPFDHYASWLRTIGAPIVPGTWYLWAQRTVLTIALIGHVWAAAVLARRARVARPVQGSYAARTMRWGGVILLLFVIFHLLDLTAGTVNPNGDPHNPYGNVVADFAPGRWYVTLFYALAIVALGFHLRHGAFSALRSLGQQTPKGERTARAVALVFAIALSVGYLVVPFSVTFGLIG